MNDREPHADEDTRRSFLKKGAFATAGAGLAASGSAAAQQGTEREETTAQGTDGRESGADDDDLVVDDETYEGIMYADQVRPFANFYITSPVLEFSPDVPERFGGPMEGYNMRMVTYVSTAERVQVFVPNDAEFPEYSDFYDYVVDDEGEFGEGEWHPPEVYNLTGNFRRFGGTDKLVRVQFAPLEEAAEASLWDDGNIESDDDLDDQRF